MADRSAAPRRRIRSDERRDLILEAAAQVFADRGYREATMAGIGAAAGVTAGLLYEHFPSKSDLLVEVLERQDSALFAAIGGAVADAPAAAEARLRAGIEAFFSFVEDHPVAWRLLFRDPPTEPTVRAAYDAMSRRATDAIAALLATFAPDEVERTTETLERAQMFAQMLKSTQIGLAQWWYDNSDRPKQEIVDRLMEFCWDGLRQQIPGP